MPVSRKIPAESCPTTLLDTHYDTGRLRGTAVERWSLTGDLSLSCARPADDG